MLNVLFPGISSKYGSTTPVDVYVNITSIGNVVLTEDNDLTQAEMTFDLQFWIAPEDGSDQTLAVWLTLQDTDISYSMSIDVMVLRFRLE